MSGELLKLGPGSRCDCDITFRSAPLKTSPAYYYYLYQRKGNRGFCLFPVPLSAKAQPGHFTGLRQEGFYQDASGIDCLFWYRPMGWRINPCTVRSMHQYIGGGGGGETDLLREGICFHEAGTALSVPNTHDVLSSWITQEGKEPGKYNTSSNGNRFSCLWVVTLVCYLWRMYTLSYIS